MPDAMGLLGRSSSFIFVVYDRKAIAKFRLSRGDVLTPLKAEGASSLAAQVMFIA